MNTEQIVFKDIRDLMTDEEKMEYLLPDNQKQTVYDGNIQFDLQPGLVVIIKKDGYEEKKFVLSLNRQREIFIGLPVCSKPCDGALKLSYSKKDIENGKIQKTGGGQLYIRTDRIETYSFSVITEIMGKGVVPSPIYLEILNAVMDLIDYDTIADKFEQEKETYTYEKFKKQNDADNTFPKRKIRRASMDPKDIVIQNMKKQNDKLNSDLITLKEYKEKSKNELNRVKQDYRDIRADFEKQRRENGEYAKKAEKAEKELQELTDKYHVLLEKYAHAEKDPALQSENENLRKLLKQREDEIIENEKAMEELNYELKKQSLRTQEIKELQSSLTAAENDVKKLTKSLTDSRYQIEELKRQIIEKDESIEVLKQTKNTGTEDVLNKEIERLKTEVENLRNTDGKASAPIKEYTLVPEECFEKETVNIPSIISFKLRKILAPVPEELRVAFLTQMIGYFEESIKNGNVIINMLTKLTL